MASTSTDTGRDDPKPNSEASKNKKAEAFSKQLNDARSALDQVTMDKQQTITRAKGRAQITATTAMSIVNVALLKNVLDTGNTYKYFYVQVTLIGMCLTLQVIAGILSMLIEHAMDYMTKHGQNLCENALENCCLCRWTRYKPKDEDQPEEDVGTSTNGELEMRPQTADSGAQTHSSSVVLELVMTPMENPEWAKAKQKKIQMAIKSTDDPMCKCFGFTCTSEVYSPIDSITLRDYYSWRAKSTDNEMMIVRAKEEIENHTEHLSEVNQQIKELETQLAVPDTTEEHKEELKHSIDKLKHTSQRHKESVSAYNECLHHAEIFAKQGELLAQYAESIRNNRVAKMVAFWQNLLNYIFYVIFIFNAFITGFGFAVSSTPDESDDNVTPTSQ